MVVFFRRFGLGKRYFFFYLSASLGQGRRNDLWLHLVRTFFLSEIIISFCVRPISFRRYGRALFLLSTLYVYGVCVWWVWGPSHLFSFIF